MGAYFGAAAEDAALVAGESEMTAGNAFSSAAAFGKTATVVAGGFAAGGIQGGNIESAAAGALSAGLNVGIGSITSGATFGDYAFAANVGLHAALGCGQQAAAGGSCRGGAMAGGFSALAGPVIGGRGPVQFAANIAIGGIASRIGGDKFSNGAITAAFNYLFNFMMHEQRIRSYNVATGEIEIEKRYSINFPADLGETLAPFAGFGDEYATSALTGGARWFAKLLSFITPDGYGTWDVKGFGAKFDAYKMDPQLRKIANDLNLSDDLYSMSAGQAREFLNHAAKLPNFTTTYGSTEQIFQRLTEKYDQSY